MIRIFDDLETLSQGAAQLFAEQAVEAVADRGIFRTALSGGSTPRRTYEILALEPLRGRVPWTGVHIFWGDERCVPPDHPESNARMAREALLDLVLRRRQGCTNPNCASTFPVQYRGST
jgi:6-phosphogluconolactonase